MAKFTIAGNALVITSDLKLSDLETVKKYRPNALKLMGGENNKEELFRIDTGSDANGGISAYGVCFGAATHDAEKKACITVSLGNVQGDIKEYVADKYGEAVMYLNQLEDSLPAVVASIAEQKRGIMANITVA